MSSPSLLVRVAHEAGRERLRRRRALRAGAARAAGEGVLAPKTCSSTTRPRSSAGAICRWRRSRASGFEMTLLRMLAFRPAGEAGQRCAPRAGAATAAAVAASAAARGRPRAAAPARALRRGDCRRRVRRSGRRGIAEPARGHAGSWRAIVSQLDLAGAARQLANQLRAASAGSGAVVQPGLDPRNQRRAHAAARWTSSRRRCRSISARPCASSSKSPLPALETPAQAGQRATVGGAGFGARRRSSPTRRVRALREKFGATLLPDSVRPVK